MRDDKKKLFGALAGAGAGLLVLLLGFWKALLIIALSALGYMWPEIKNTLERLHTCFIHRHD